MSSRTKVIVTCPKCNKEHSIRIWRSINTTLDPDLQRIKNWKAKMPNENLPKCRKINRQNAENIV